MPHGFVHQNLGSLRWVVFFYIYIYITLAVISQWTSAELFQKVHWLYSHVCQLKGHVQRVDLSWALHLPHVVLDLLHVVSPTGKSDFTMTAQTFKVSRQKLAVPLKSRPAAGVVSFHPIMPQCSKSSSPAEIQWKGNRSNLSKGKF